MISDDVMVHFFKCHFEDQQPFGYDEESKFSGFEE